MFLLSPKLDLFFAVATSGRRSSTDIQILWHLAFVRLFKLETPQCYVFPNYIRVLVIHMAAKLLVNFKETAIVTKDYEAVHNPFDFLLFPDFPGGNRVYQGTVLLKCSVGQLLNRTDRIPHLFQQYVIRIHPIISQP